MPTVAELVALLNPDSWRTEVPFSEDVRLCSEILLDQNVAEVHKLDSLRHWLATQQPCVFGRLAASQADLISFCLLGETELSGHDAHIQSKIEAARNSWKQDALEGRKSAFIIVAAAQRIYHARPNAALRDLAVRLLSLYLSEERNIRVDTAYQDSVSLLDYPATGGARTFGVGVNFFGSQGDRRWWHDHRFPAGIAFSMNSPGHMAHAGEQRKIFLESIRAASEKAGATVARVRELSAELNRLKRTSVTSLPQVLKFAMITIRQASQQPDHESPPFWEPATSLARRDHDVPCPFIELAKDNQLGEFDFSKYLGWYHTDHTIPSDYFREDVQRPTDLRQFVLDFSYIHDRSLEAYQSMSAGQKTHLKLVPARRKSQRKSGGLGR